MKTRYCTECGTELEPNIRFCTECGHLLEAPPADSPPEALTAPPPDSRRPPWAAAVAVGLVVVAVLIGVLLASSRPTSPPVAASPTSPPTTRATPQPDSSPTEPLMAQTPGQAMRLSPAQARTQLRQRRKTDIHSLGPLQYEWSPQVSSKCEGLDNVDLGPGWFANGSPETDNLRAQQILAFHLSLSDRDGALLVTDRDVGVRTIYSGCGGNPMWMAIVPKSFASATAANRWCDRNGYTLDECAARYVVPRGESGSEVVWRG